MRKKKKTRYDILKSRSDFNWNHNLIFKNITMNFILYDGVQASPTDYEKRGEMLLNIFS